MVSLAGGQGRAEPLVVNECQMLEHVEQNA